MNKRIVIPILILFLFSSCRDSGVDNALQDVLSLEPEDVREKVESDPDRIAELKSKIEEHKKVVDKAVQASGDIGIIYKLLAVEYMRREMYGLAKDALENAIAVYPENPVLFQMAGVCYARMAKASVDPAERKRLLSVAVAYYKRALELSPDMKDALYGISVVYIFELDEPQSAINYLTRLISIDPEFMEARFLLARAYYSVGEFDSAIEQYMYVIKNSKNKEYVAKAKENISRINGDF